MPIVSKIYLVNAVTGGTNPLNGTLGYLGLFTPTGKKLGNSIIYQSGGAIGINTTSITTNAIVDINLSGTFDKFVVRGPSGFPYMQIQQAGRIGYNMDQASGTTYSFSQNGQGYGMLLAVSNSNQTGLLFGAYTTYGLISTNNVVGMRFAINGFEVLRLDDNLKFSIGTASYNASQTAKFGVRNDDPNASGVIATFKNSINNLSLAIKNNGTISTPYLQIGNAGLSSGDQYQDTAANILANGDKVVGIKV